MDRFISLSVFVAAVEGGSIAAAGRRYGLSAVMAGRYLSALEESLSARLLQRTTRRLSLTEVGQAYFARAKRILEELADADEEAGDLQASPRGELRVAAPITFGAMYLGPITARYMSEFPGVKVALQLQDRFVDLVEEGLDLAIRIGKLADSDLVARKLADCRLMACATPGYLAAAGCPGEPSELTLHALIGYSGAVTTPPWAFMDRQGRMNEIAVNCRVLANNTEVMLEIALAGFGIVYGPSFVFAKHLERGDLVPVLSNFPSPVLPLHAITVSAKQVNLKTTLFIEELKRAFASPAPWERWSNGKI